MDVVCRKYENREREESEEGEGGTGSAGIGGRRISPVALPVPLLRQVPQLVYKPVEEKIELAPRCHNGAGFAVPCA